MSHLFWRPFGAVVITVLGVLLSGCAVQLAPKRAGSGLDNAALFETELAKFKLQDETAGTLRAYSGAGRDPQFSVNLEKYMKVIDLGTAERMRFERAVHVGDRTLVVITRYEKQCVRTTLLAIKASDVLNWTLNHADCRSEPEILPDDDRLYLSYGRARFVYREGNLTKEIVHAAATPSAPPGAAPKLGVNAGVVSADAKAPPSRTAARPAPKPALSSSVTPPTVTPVNTKPLDFQAQVQKPIRIILD